MSTNPQDAGPEPTRTEVDAHAGLQVVEFGASWCPHCQRAQPLIEQVLRAAPAHRHLRIEDGPGRRLGRTFQVKLWPTFVFMKDGQELARVVRPTEVEPLVQALAQATGARPVDSAGGPI